MIVVMFLSMIIQNMLQSRFEKYSRVRTNSGMTGAEIARKMLADHRCQGHLHTGPADRPL